jgi:SAM-dependent methyltransferase
VKDLHIFDTLVRDALEAPLEGWDFPYLEGRKTDIELPWDYAAIVRTRMNQADSVLDLGTGGGEFLSALAPFHARIRATEGYPLNVDVARKRLEPLGVEVCDTRADPTNRHLPFADGEFDLIIDRHDEYVAPELFRVLRAGGQFITQQCGGYGEAGLIEWFVGKGVAEPMDWTAAVAALQLREAGFRVTNVHEVYPEYSFLDVGAVVYDLRTRPWNVEGFSVLKYRDRLLAMHKHMEKHGSFIVKDQRFLVEAVKPPAL